MIFDFQKGGWGLRARPRLRVCARSARNARTGKAATHIVAWAAEYMPDMPRAEAEAFAKLVMAASHRGVG